MEVGIDQQPSLAALRRAVLTVDSSLCSFVCLFVRPQTSRFIRPPTPLSVQHSAVYVIDSCSSSSSSRHGRSGAIHSTTGVPRATTTGLVSPARSTRTQSGQRGNHAQAKVCCPVFVDGAHAELESVAALTRSLILDDCCCCCCHALDHAAVTTTRSPTRRCGCRRVTRLIWPAKYRAS